MGAVFGLLAAATYGAADFVGGLVSRRTNVFGVVLFSQAIGAVPLMLLIPWFAGADPTWSGVAWGLGAGVAGGTGVLFLYRGLAVGRMTVVAPTTAVVAAAAPVAFGLLRGERPTAAALIGVAVAFVAVALVSSSPQAVEDGDGIVEETRRRARSPGLAHAIVAGFSFGAFFILLDGAGDDTGLWPLVGTRISSLSVVGVAGLATRQAVIPREGTWPEIAGAGLLDVAANFLYLLATRRGLLSIVAVLTSMYPASTVVLARFVLGERLAATQLAGLLGAVASIALIVLG